MTRASRRGLIISCLFTVLSFVAGCGGDRDPAEAGLGPGAGPGAFEPNGPGPAANAGIRQIMFKLNKGPNALTQALKSELAQNPPPWETIQAHTKEYAQLTAELSDYDPPRGTKESWKELTLAFADTASELNKAALAKDARAALSAHGDLENACNSCHREHRRMGGPGGGMGGPPGGRGRGRPPGPPGFGGPTGGPGSGPPPVGPPGGTPP
jgi:hypothetical protein